MGEHTMYKISYGQDGFRGIEYASRCNAEIVAALWGHQGTTAITTHVNRTDSTHPHTIAYHITDDRAFTDTPLLVTCELIPHPA